MNALSDTLTKASPYTRRDVWTAKKATCFYNNKKKIYIFLVARFRVCKRMQCT